MVNNAYMYRTKVGKFLHRLMIGDPCVAGNENELARLSGVPQPTIHRILTGESENPRRPTLESSKKIIRFCIDSPNAIAYYVYTLKQQGSHEMNPYFHTDNDYYRSLDKEWDRVIDLERKAEEIRNDPDLLEKAIEEYAQQMQDEEVTQAIIDKCEYLGRQAI